MRQMYMYIDQVQRLQNAHCQWELRLDHTYTYYGVYQCAVAWDGVDNDIKCCNSITSYKHL